MRIQSESLSGWPGLSLRSPGQRVHDTGASLRSAPATHCRRAGRPAFTLVEMLVVISILLLLTVAAVAIYPRFTDDRKLARAADQLAQILLTTKQRSKRDLIPTGVRLFPDPQHNGLVTQLVYIQQPDDFAVGTVTLTTTTTNNPTLSGIIASNFPGGVNWSSSYGGSILTAQATGTLDFTGGFLDSTLWPVQPGDYLNVSGSAHLILAVIPPSGPPATPSYLVLAPVAPFQPGAAGPGGNDLTLTNLAQISVSMLASWNGALANATSTKVTKLNSTSPSSLSVTLNGSTTGAGGVIGFVPNVSSNPTTYSVIRRPRVLQGETPLQLPTNICIDPNPKYVGDPYPFAVPADIMFSPQGGTLNYGLAAGKASIVLWVRDYTKDVTYPVASWPPGGQPGDQFLILIQTHTGFIAEHPVDIGSANPYTFTQDARSSGL